MTKVRKPNVLMLGVAMIAASIALGALLIHDGAVGTDASRLAYADEGDDVKFRGEVDEAFRATVAFAPLLTNTTYIVDVDIDAMVLVTDLAPDLDGTYVFEGEVVYVDEEANIIIVAASSVTEPIVFS